MNDNNLEKVPVTFLHNGTDEAEEAKGYLEQSKIPFVTFEAEGSIKPRVYADNYARPVSGLDAIIIFTEEHSKTQ